MQQLAEANQAIARIYEETGRVPPPDTNGHLVLDGRVVEDGFGNPLRYAVRARWKLVSWTLTSSGFAQFRAADDLCLSGHTELARWAGTLRAVANLLDEIKSGTASTGDRLAGIRALRCPT